MGRGLVPRQVMKTVADGSGFQVGDDVTVYITGKAVETGKIQLSFQPLSSPRKGLGTLVCDGRHPYPGVVKSVQPYGVFVDINSERPGLLPIGEKVEVTGLSSLDVGTPVTVYITRKHPKTGRFQLSLTPSEVSRMDIRDIAADGQTPYQGVVTAILDGVAI